VTTPSLLAPDRTAREAYAADNTYSTNNELGFDYLRDNMVREVDQLRQRPLHLRYCRRGRLNFIDEARTPLDYLGALRY